MVLVEACDAFVTILPSGDMVSAVRGEKVSLPAAVADRLVKGGLAKAVEATRSAPENKAEGPAPEVKKAAPKRAAAKPKPAPAD